MIYVRTSDGERMVGSWQAGAPDEGLAHFARRFDDMATEVELLFHRLTAGGDPKHALGSARAMRDGLADATVVGDLLGLHARLEELISHAEAAATAARAARDAQRTAAVTRKEELAAEAEQLAAEATQWKQAGDRFKAILDEWRTIRGIDRKTDEQLWKRFSRAREAFNRRRGSHFADLDRQRAGAKHRKEELAEEAEKLADSDEWGPTAARFRDLMAEWKAAGRAHKDADDALWQRFRTAQDAFFARRIRLVRRTGRRVRRQRRGQASAAHRGREDRHLRPDRARGPRCAPSRSAGRRSARSPATTSVRWRRGCARSRRRCATPPTGSGGAPTPRPRPGWRSSASASPHFEAQAAKARAAGDAKRAAQADAQAAQWREWLGTAEQAVQHR